ncbi:MAG: hypothetical protein ACI4KN_04980 [Gemmiger sp.]
MLIGTCKGETVHCFSIGGKRYCVRRGSVFVAAWDKRTDVVGVLAPAGMSYHQAALEAAARMERGEYI